MGAFRLILANISERELCKELLNIFCLRFLPSMEKRHGRNVEYCQEKEEPGEGLGELKEEC